MKKKPTFLFPPLVLVFLLASGQLSGQTGPSENFQFRLFLGPSSFDFPRNVDCGFLAAQFGSNIDADICGDIVWAYDQTSDSLACQPIADQSLAGKFALIRRGGCDFSLKAWHARHAGAVAVLIVNHYDYAPDGPCTQAAMPPGAFADQIDIPVIGIARETGELIDSALQSGESVSACLLLPRLYGASVPYHYATPFDQVDTLRHMMVHYVNVENVAQTGVELKIQITEPDGNVATRTVNLGEVPPGADTAVFFPPYLPPSVQGEFQVLITSNTYSEPRDSLRGKFVHTQCYYASDNLHLQRGGIGASNTDFVSGGYIRQEGNMYRTGPNPAYARFISFQIANIDSVFVPLTPPGSTANDISVFLYDGDFNTNGLPDLGEQGWGNNFNNLYPVAFGYYVMDGEEMEGWPIAVLIKDFVTEQPVELLPNHFYYASVLYLGAEANLGRDIRFSKTAKPWSYLDFPTNPVVRGTETGPVLFNGWKDVAVITQLHLQGCFIIDGVKPVLPELTGLTITPNPASAVLNVDLDLEVLSERVTLTLLDPIGRVVQTRVVDQFQEGRITMPVQDVPSGAYLLWVRAANGASMRKVLIGH